MERTERVLGGRYVLRDVLGVGGMAVVWRAHDEVLGRQVAVKLLSGRYAADPVSRQRIRLEARAAAALSHPNVAQVYDFGETEEDGRCTPFVVMELVTGPTLEDRAAVGPLAPAVVFRLGAQVAAALAVAHADGMVHRDIKPANIMLTPLGAKVVDFGIAAAVRPAGLGDPNGELLGTPSYLAPERLTGDAVESASDVYSLGVLLYRLLAGQMPWTTAGVTEILEAHLHTEPTPLPALTGVPDAVVALCDACLAKDPAARPTARQAALVLAEAAGIRAVDDELARTLALVTAGGESSTVLVLRPTGPKVRRRHRRGVLVLAGAAAVGAVIIAWPLLSGGNPVQARAGQQPSGSGQRSSSALATAGDAVPTVSAGVPVPAGATPTPGPPAAPHPTGDARNVPGTAGSTPAGAAPVGSTPAGTTTTAPTGSATFTSAGGTVTASCDGANEAQLTSWKPNKSYTLGRVQAGPASQALVEWQHGKTVVRMTVTCTGGTPAESTTSTPGK